MICARLALCLGLFVLAGGTAHAADDKNNWTPLFNGKDLDGWYRFVDGQAEDRDPNQIFTVHDGMLHIYRDVADGAQAPFGWVATKKHYANYHLRLQYRWGGKRFAPRAQVVRDSGILYHVMPGEMVLRPWPRSVECQIQEQDVGDIYTVGTTITTTVEPESRPKAHKYQEASAGGVPVTVGDAKSVARVIKSATHEHDDWNTVEVIVRGDTAEHIVNGKVNNRLTDIKAFNADAPDKPVKLAAGQILLQAEGAEVLYRNVEIKLLEANALGAATEANAKPRKTNSAVADSPSGKVLQAGAYALNIDPPKLPVIVNGGFTEQRADKVVDSLYSRALVLDDGPTRIAFAIVDNVALPRDLTDRAIELTYKATRIPRDRICIAATHTHSAPSVFPCLGSRADEAYVEFLVRQIARSIQLAADRLAPAEIGWTVLTDFDHIHCRNWIKRRDRIDKDPFGDRTVRMMMHPGHLNPEYVGPAGPVDPNLSLVSLRSPDGRPIALLANYCNHYYGSPPLSSDYFGQFCQEVEGALGHKNGDPPFVAIMSQGTNGDQMWLDYGKPRRDIGYKQYAREVADRALEGYQKIQYQRWAPIVMREASLKVRTRRPDEAHLARARANLAKFAGRLPQTLEEVYAQEQVLNMSMPDPELRLQAIRIGELGLTAMPVEAYGLTGLKLKAQSPLQPTINLGLAGGEIGYIPPPEQHKLGGYNSWLTRYATEFETEPKLVEMLLGLLEQVSGKPRRTVVVSNGPYAEAVLASKPVAYWRMEDMNPPVARDASGHDAHGAYEDLIALYLDGPVSDDFSGAGTINRAVHLAGGRIRADAKLPADRYSLEMWFWSGLPNDAHSTIGYLLARDSESRPGDRLAIGGTERGPGRLVFTAGTAAPLVGKQTIKPRTWNHLVLVRTEGAVRIWLNNAKQPDLEGAVATSSDATPILIGGTLDDAYRFEGKIDEVSLYDRTLTADEVAAHFGAVKLDRDTN